VSIRAVAYVKELKECEDGAALSAGQKLLLMVLADYHNPETRTAWPSLPTLAGESLVSEAQARRYLQYLERHCVVIRLKPTSQGRGQKTEYSFLAIDQPKELARRLNASAEGLQDDTLFSTPKRVAEGLQIEPKRVAEGLQIGDAYKEEPRTRSNLNLARPRIVREPSSFRTGQSKYTTAEIVDRPERKPPEGANVESACSTWRTVAGAIREEIGQHAYEIWLKPAHALWVLDEWLYVELPTRDYYSIVTERYRVEIDKHCKSVGLQGVILMVAMEAAS
jgi:hypothetical protein